MVCRDLGLIIVFVAAGSFWFGTEYDSRFNPNTPHYGEPRLASEEVLDCEVPDLTWPVQRPDGALDEVSGTDRIWLNRRDDQFKELVRERQKILERVCEP